MGERLFEISPDTSGSIERNRLSRWIEARREEGLNAVRQRIEPGGRGQGRRQTESELRITDRPPGNQMRADEPELATIVQRDERCATHFRARSRRRRDCDERSNR